MKSNTFFSSILRIFFGLLLVSAGYGLFLTPHSISVGGITGLSVVIYEQFNLPCSFSMLAMNGGLFLWGLRVKGRAYILRSLSATLILGILLDIPVPLFAMLAPTSRVLSMILGSTLTGVGYGLIVASDTSTGGSDLLAMIVTKHKKAVTVGMVMNAVDVVSIVASAFSGGIGTLPFSLTAMVLCNSLIDVTAYGFGEAEIPQWLQQITKWLPRHRKRPLCDVLRSFTYATLTFSMFFLVVRTCMVAISINPSANL